MANLDGLSYVREPFVCEFAELWTAHPAFALRDGILYQGWTNGRGSVEWRKCPSLDEAVAASGGVIVDG